MTVRIVKTGRGGLSRRNLNLHKAGGESPPRLVYGLNTEVLFVEASHIFREVLRQCRFDIPYEAVMRRKVPTGFLYMSMYNLSLPTTLSQMSLPFPSGLNSSSPVSGRSCLRVNVEPSAVISVSSMHGLKSTE